MFGKTAFIRVTALAVLVGISSAVGAVERLVTAGGTLTDIVLALDGKARLVATDSSSQSIPAAQDLPIVGYYRDLSSEGVLSFAPKALWVLDGGGRDQALEQVRAAGVSVEQFAKPDSVAELYGLIGRLAVKLDAQEKGEQLIKQLKQQMSHAAASVDKSALFVLQASSRGVIAAGTDTVPQLLFDANGLTNVATHKGFKPLSVEYLAVNQPDVLIAPEHTVSSVGGKQGLCEQAALKLLNAAQECRVLVMDSLLALGMTTRLPQAIQTVARFVEGERISKTAVVTEE